MACPICNRKSDEKLRPFCSKRCADVDLAKWFSGGYAISTPLTDEDEDALQEIEETAQRQNPFPH